MSHTERRCPRCRALVAEDATWCGQCLEPLAVEPGSSTGPAGSSEVTPPSGAASRAGAATGGSTERPGAAPDEPTWPCPACGHANAIGLDRCEVCGTAFAQLFAEPGRSVEIDPSRAMAWSLLWPGLGHWKAGHRLDGVARMALFAWTFGTVIVFLASRSGGGFGSAGALFAMFLVASVVLYVISAVDARRVAAGDEPLVSSRTLLWASVGLVVLSVVLATFLALPAARGR